MINFRIGTIPVSIKPTFWIVAVVLGLPVPTRHSQEMFSYLVGWIAVVVFSVLAHELGHALAARRFGAEVAITLHVMGGYTTWATPQPISPLRRVLVAAAGSGVGFLLAGATFGVVRGFDISIDNRLFASLASAFVFVNIVWGIFNWLPIRPLDGGHILSGFLQAALGRKAAIVLDVIFPITTVAVGLLAYRQGLIFAAFFCGFLLLDEMRNWQSRRPGPPPAPGGLPPALG